MIGKCLARFSDPQQGFARTPGRNAVRRLVARLGQGEVIAHWSVSPSAWPSSACRHQTIFGPWATLAPAVHAPRSFMTTATISGAGLPAPPTRTATVSSRIWNLVFMQYEQVAKARARKPSPALDRHRHGPGACLRSVFQGMHDNYDTDLVPAPDRDIDRPRAGTAGTRFGAHPSHVTYRVIADHLRPRPSSSPTACCRPMKAAAMCCAASCAAPCAMRICWAPRAPDAPAGAGAGGAKWAPPIPELKRAEAADRRDAEAGGNPLPRNAGARPQTARRSSHRPRRPATASPAMSPSSSTTLMAFRSTSRRNRCARAVSQSIPTASTLRDGTPARRGARRLGGLGRSSERRRNGST